MKKRLEQFAVDEEDIGILLGPRYVDEADVKTGQRLPEDERYWAVEVNARVLDEAEVGYDVSFNAEIRYEEMDMKEFFEQEYPYWVGRFREEFPEAEKQFVDLVD